MQKDLTQKTTSPSTLAAQPISAEVLIEKYSKGDETTIEQVNQRVARALAQAEEPEQRTLWEQRFMQA
ncbi:MAG: ribonucleotide reductase N-terminal alpha domain-containing protein, partial [Betaproteobacteria bacterium]